MFVVMVSSGGFRSTIYCHISYVHNIIFNRYHANRARLVIVLGSIEIILKMTYNVDIWLRSPVIMTNIWSSMIFFCYIPCKNETDPSLLETH